jgi:hypothetical protein
MGTYYGNVVFVPENRMDIRIVMQSGRTGKPGPEK